MADADVQGMLIRIEATTAQLRQEIARGDAAVAQSAGKMDTSLGRIDSAFDRTGANAGTLQAAVSAAFTGIGLASAAAVAGLVAITAKTTSYAQEVKNLSSVSNSSVTDFQRLAAGAKTVGIEQDKLGDILKDTSDRVGEFIQRGGGEMADFFKEIAPKVGVTAQMFATLSGPDALQLYYNSLEKAGLNQAQMTTYMESMADEATALIPLLKNNGEGFKTFGDRAEKAGQILKSFEIDQLVEVNQSIKALEGSFEGASRQMVLGMLPGIQSVTEQLTSLSNNGAMEVLGAGVSFLADHLNILAGVMGTKVAASFIGYVQSLGASALASNQARSANIAQAASAVEAAAANQIAAQSAVVRAEREAVAARGTAVQTQMSIQLAEARMAERNATAQLTAAQAGLKSASTGLLGILGGPAGIAALAIGAGIAFLTMRDNTSLLEKKLGDLADPLDKLTERFDKLNRATQAVALRELQANIADTQTKLGQMSGAMADKFENDLRNMGAAGADGLMAGLASLPADTQAALDLVRQASKDQAAGMTVDWKAVADQLRLMPGVTEDMARTLESSQSPVTDLSAALQKQQQTLAALTAETDKNTVAQNANSAAKADASEAGEKYIGELTKQLQTAQDKTAMEQANRFIAENKDLTEGQIVAIRSLAAAKDVQKTADDAATQSTKDGSSAAKEAATEVKNQTKALTDLKAQADIAIASAAGLAAAYLAGTDKSREFTLQQKVEETLLKTGAGARAEVIAKLIAERDAQDKLNISKSVYDLGKETDDLLAQAKATLVGADALAAYNVQKSMTIALAGKSLEVGSKEYEQLLAATKAQQAAVKVAQQAANAGGIMERLYPEAKLLKDYAEDQQALNAAMALYPENAANYQAALVKLGNEYEVNRSKSTLWGQMTEGAIDRIDDAFATAWGNIGSGAESLWDNLKKGFKQTLGEIAHMLTTKPLLASISNWLTGGDNGQGLSSVWGKLLGSIGGSGSGGGSGGFGGLAGLGKNLYSAWSTITGVGSSVASGYASGGISGALSGGASYYGNMLSNISSTLSNGFTSLASTITGTAAVQTAAMIGAQGVTSAVLSGAVTEGAAAMGTQFTTGVATTTAATYAAAEAGAAATAASLGGQISAAVSSAAAMWPLAVVMGMYQSGKLYDSGVRADAGEIMDSGGKTAFGKAVMAPGAVMSKGFAMVDDALSPLVGEKWAAILSGSTLHQVVTKYVGEKLFGGSWQTKNSGITLGVENGQLEAEQFIDQKKKGGLFSNSKKRTRYSALDAQTAESMAAVYDATEQGVIALVSRIGISANEGTFVGLNIAKSKLSTKGKTGEEIQKLVSDWFSSVSDQMVGFLDGGTGGFGYSFAELAQRIASFETFNDTLDTLNIAVLGLSPHSMELANSLIAAAGGMEAFQSATNTYYDNFLSESEKADDALSAITKQFSALGVALPGTRDAYRGMVEALDMTTASGQSMFMTLTGLAGNAAQAYSILEQRAAEAAQAAEAAAQAAAEAATKAAESAAEEAAQAAQAFVDALKGAVTGANGAVQRAIAAEQKATTEAYNARITSLNDMVTTATEHVSGLTAVGNDLSAALKALRGDSDDAVKMLRAQAQATLQSALATAKAGGSLSGLTGLEDALDTVGTNTTDLYSSLEDFNRDQGRTANVVAELNGINGKQLTTAEKSLKGLETQIELAKAAYDAQMAAFDSQLAFAQAQLDALNGIDNSVLSVAAAMQQMNAAVVAALAGQAAGAAMQNTTDNNVALLESVYRAVLGRGLDGNGLATWTAALANGTVTYENLAQTIATGGRLNGETIMPGYATGGLISGPGTGTSDSIFARLSNGEYVMSADAVRMFGTGLLDQMNAGLLPAFARGGAIGETGPQLQITAPNRIYNANQAASMSGGDSNNATVVVELRALRAELESIKANTQASALNGGKLVRIVDRVTDGGNAMLTKELA
jgi:hypothetical protein